MPATERAFDRFLKDYPFPIAFALKDSVIEATSAEHQVRGIIQTLTTSIQYIALICASEYARANYRDVHLSWSLESLKRPLISHFFNFADSAVKSFQENGISPLVAEMATFLEQMERTQVVVPVMVDNVAREQKLQLQKALVALRNTLGHKLYNANWSELAAQYSPLLRAFLEALNWTTRYPLLRLVGGGQMARLMGADPRFQTELIPDSALDELGRTQHVQQFTGLLLAADNLTRFLSLYPLVVMEPCEDCQKDLMRGLTEEVFLFNGDEGRYLTYLGVRHHFNTVHYRDAVDAVYEQKKAPPPVIKISEDKLSELVPRAGRHSERLLSINKAARRYLPQVYHPRVEMEAALRAFLQSPSVGFCLLGESGIGKTTLLCRKVEEWSAKMTAESSAPPGFIVMFYTGKGLFAQGELERRILSDLYLEGSFPNLLNCFQRAKRQLILIIDGVNEDENPARNLQAICQFITRYASPPGAAKRQPPIKVLFSFRSAFFDKTLRALGYANEGDELSELFSSRAFFTREFECQGQIMATYRFALERVTVEEAEAIYEAYRGFEGLTNDETATICRFRPLTPFSGLNPTTRRLLTHPWYLRMVLEAFDGRRVPKSLWVGKLLEEFCRAKVYGRTECEREVFADRAIFVDELVTLMRAQRSDTVERGDPKLSPRLAQAILERQVALSPYLHLLDEGVLMEIAETDLRGHRPRTRYFVRFTFDPLYEYLLAENILREAGGWEGLTSHCLADLAAQVEEIDNATQALHLVGVLEFLATEAAQQNRVPLLVSIFNAIEVRAAVALFGRVMVLLEETEHPAFEPLIDALAENGQLEKALRLAEDVSFRLSRRGRLMPALKCASCDETLSRRLEGHERQNALKDILAGVLLNKASLLSDLGFLWDSVAVHDQAITLFREVLDTGGYEVVGQPLAITLRNKGVALAKLRRYAEAIASLDEADDVIAHITTGSGWADTQHNVVLLNKGMCFAKMECNEMSIQCSEEAINWFESHSDEKTPRTEMGLATALSNKGVCLLRMNRLDDALRSCEQALKIRYRLFEEGWAEVATDLLSSLVNKGNILIDLGCSDDAIDCFAEAIRLGKQFLSEGRVEVAQSYEKALLRRGQLFCKAGDYNSALKCQTSAIDLLKTQAEKGIIEFAPDLLKALRVRFELLVQLDNLEQAAEDLRFAFGVVDTVLEVKPKDKSLVIGRFLDPLRSLPEDKRLLIYNRLGPYADLARKIVEERR